MKHGFLLFFFLPLLVNAQSMYSDPRNANLAPVHRLRSLVLTGLVETRKDPLPDTMFQEVQSYDENGRQFASSYRFVLDKTNFLVSSNYQYGDGVYTRLSYAQGKMQDSVIVRGDSAFRFFSGGYLKHIYAGDSVTEAETVNGVRVIDEKRCLSCRDSFWDYKNAGKFYRKSSTAGATTDTIRYWNEQNECLIMIVNYFSESRNVILTEYYNYGCKKFEFRRYQYNESMDVLYWLEKSRKGKPSFTIARKFDENGLLTEERLAGTNRKAGVLVLKYVYTFY